MGTERNQVFLSYSHADARWLKRLQVHLIPYEREGVVRRWDDTLIRPGQRWREEIKNALAATRVAVLLVSADFLASAFIASHELPSLLAAAESDGAVILPVILSACAFDQIEGLCQFQAVNPVSQPLSKLSKAKQEAIFDRLARSVREALQSTLIRAAPPDAAGVLCGLPARNLIFCGQEAVLEKISATLMAHRRIALCGLGGIGKTELAVEFAHRRRSDYKNIFFVSATTRDSMVSGFSRIANVLHLPQAESSHQNAVVEAVHRRLASQNGWLMILDDADDLSLAREFAPQCDGGHLIVTTRSTATGAVAARLQVPEMTTLDAVLLLLKRTKIAGPVATWSELRADDRAVAETIVQELGRIPLAIDQAGAYIEETACGLSGYLALWQRSSVQLLAERGEGASGHVDPVTSTWTLSFELVRSADPAAAELLCLLTFFDPTAVPEELIVSGAEALGDLLQEVVGNPIRFNAALKQALRYSLLRRDSQSKSLSMARLVQLVLKERLSEQERGIWAERAIAALTRAARPPKFATWPVWERLAPHVARLVSLSEADVSIAGARLLEWLGSYYHQRGRYAEAELPLRRAIEIFECSAGAENRGLSAALNSLGKVYKDIGRYADAARCLEGALELREHAFGPNHSVTAETLFALGDLAHLTGRNTEGKAFHTRALSIRQETLGRDHPQVADSLNALAAIETARENWSKAEELFREALAIREAVFPADHPSIAQSVNNIAVACRKQGRNSEARALYERALDIRERSLGANHPDIAESLNNLGYLTAEVGDFERAEPLYLRAIEIRQRALGESHPKVALCLCNLAALQRSTKRLEESTTTFERALNIQESTIGLQHPDTIETLVDLVELCLQRNLEKNARHYYERAKAVATQHPELVPISLSRRLSDCAHAFR